jgi:hypothetical protein
MSKKVRLWIGGTSGLTQSYLQAFPEESWIVLGRSDVAPAWLSSSHQHTCKYVSCNLTGLIEMNNGTNSNSPATSSSISVNRVVEQLKEAAAHCSRSRTGENPNNTTNSDQTTVAPNKIDQVVIGLRPPLVTWRSNAAAHRYNARLLQGLETLLRAVLCSFQPDLIVHISSIAAVNHIQKQRMVSVLDCPNDPSSADLHQPYDKFKRGSEELVQRLCSATAASSGGVQFTNLRLGAIFTDTPTCIQCTALSLQLFTGPYLPTRIDCNSGRNAAIMIHLILHRQSSSSSSSLRSVYYYTRCISSFPQPVPYGEFLLLYKRAYGLHWIPLLLPAGLVEWTVVRLLHWWTTVLTSRCHICVPYLESIDYLLQVTLDEHTFDMKETVQDFPDIVDREEPVTQCFVRRRRFLEVAVKSKTS